MSDLEQILLTSRFVTEQHSLEVDEISRQVRQHRIRRGVGHLSVVHDFENGVLYDAFLEELDDSFGDAETVALAFLQKGERWLKQDLRAFNGDRNYLIVDPRRNNLPRPDHARDFLPRDDGGLGRITIFAVHATGIELDDASRFFDPITNIEQAITLVGDQAELVDRSLNTRAQGSSFIDTYQALVDIAEQTYTPRDCPYEHPALPMSLRR